MSPVIVRLAGSTVTVCAAAGLARSMARAVASKGRIREEVIAAGDIPRSARLAKDITRAVDHW
jgi:hypothetical protein